MAKNRRKLRKQWAKIDKALGIAKDGTVLPVHTPIKRTRSNAKVTAKCRQSSIPRPNPNQSLRMNPYKCSLGRVIV